MSDESPKNPDGLDAFRGDDPVTDESLERALRYNNEEREKAGAPHNPEVEEKLRELIANRKLKEMEQEGKVPGEGEGT